MNIQSKEIKLVPVTDIKPHPRNANKHSKDQIERLAKIIEYSGFRQPLVVSNLSGLLISGHGRLEAAVQLGMNEVPVIFEDFENEDMELQHLTADNATASWAELDLSIVNQLVPELGPDFDLDMLGIKDFVLEPADKEGLTDPDSVPSNVDTRVKLGDVWRLGEHRLMCGDSTSTDAVEKLMNGEKADMVFTDPPYGMKLDTDYSFAKNTYENVKSKGGNKYKPVAGDGEDFAPQLINTVFAAFPDCPEVFLWGADYYADLLPNRNDGSWIVWDKRQNDSEDDDAAESADKAFGSAFELCWSKAKHKRIFARIRSGIFGVNNEQGNSKRVHPTEKPVQLAGWFLNRWGKDKSNIVDLFGGSGSTLIACEKTKRKCFMMELDAHYCDVILKRWEDFTGKQAELAANG